MAATIYYENDADLSHLKGKTIAILGYGSQGHAQAQNLKDSGCDVVIGQRAGSANYDLAVSHGFKPMSIAEVTKAERPRSLEEFAGEHGTPAQRAYNVMCMAYGADAKVFGDFVEKGVLPRERAEICEEEYEQVQDAYEALVSPHIDQALAKLCSL